MPIPVIVVVPAKANQGKYESALRNWSHLAQKTLLDSDLRALLSEKFAEFSHIDPDYVPIPLGRPVGAGRDTLEDYEVGASETFGLRAWITQANSCAECDNLNLPGESDGKFIFSDPSFSQSASAACFGTPARGTSADVREALRIESGVDILAGLNGSGVAIAIMDNGINLLALKKRMAELGETPVFKLDSRDSWAPKTGKEHEAFYYPTEHGTMCAFDALIAAPNATLLDYPVHHYPLREGGIVKRLMSTAIQGLGHLKTVWKEAKATKKYKGLVLSHSWGVASVEDDFAAGKPGRYIDNPDHSFNKLVRSLSRSGVDVVVSAGNCGKRCPQSDCRGIAQPILGARGLARVLTVGGCDLNHVRAGYSSRGRAITPNTLGRSDKRWNRKKPDILAYTHFDGSRAFGSSVDEGTSVSAPVAAGCIAALRTHQDAAPDKVEPLDMIHVVRTTARQITGEQATWNQTYGYGVIDLKEAARKLQLIAKPALNSGVQLPEVALEDRPQ